MTSSKASKLKAIVADKRGGVAMTFGLVFLPSMLVAGAAVDYSRSAAQWSNLQQATDATALTTAHSYLNSTSTTSNLQTFAQTYIAGLMNGAQVTSVAIGANNTQVCVATTLNVPTVFMKIVRINSVTVSTHACSQVGSTFEIALALDNSGSMAESAGSQSKIQALQSAATQLVSTLIPSGTTLPHAAISIVPFTSMVNVGGSTTASFLDTAGGSSIHWQNFHRPAGSTLFQPTSKLSLYSAMSPAVAWGGCVEERPVPYTTTDTAASSSTPDTMFVPYFAPDEPGPVDSGGSTTFSVSSGSGFGWGGGGSSNPTYTFYNSYIADNGSPTTVGVCGKSTAYAAADNVTTYSGDGQTNIYPQSGLSMVCKYSGTKASSASTSVGLPSGPNMMCNSQQLTPLTTNTSTLNTAINAMQASGSTDLAAGFMWAWRSISPVVNPFPTTSTATIGPQNPKSYGPQTNNTKIIILMTDGYNSWTSASNNPFLSLYEAFGYYANQRIASYSTANPAVRGSTTCSGSTTTSSTSRCQLDNVTLEACQNARNAQVLIYTIGFSIPSDPIDSQGLNMLQNCATNTSNYYTASDSAGIMSAFQQIAASIQNLHLTQ